MSGIALGQRLFRRPLVRRLIAGSAALVMATAGPTSHVLSQALAAPLWTVSGIVQTTDGHHVANAPVGLSILKPASKTPTSTVYLAQTVTGPDGSFSIPAPSLSPAAFTQAASNDGWLNLELDASATLGTANGDVMYLGSQVFSVLIGPSQVTAAPIGTVRTAPNGDVILLYGYKGLALDAAGPTVNNILRKIPCYESGCIDSASTPAIDSQCGQDWYSIANENDEEPIGEFHTWDDMSGNWNYGKTASTNLGVSFNYESGQGWNLNGTAYMGQSSSYSTGSGTVSGRYGYQQDGEFAWEQDESDSPCQGRNIYRIVPDWWTGGSAQGGDVSGNDGPNSYYNVPSQYHADVRAGAPVDISSGTGYTYTVQVSAFGITLSSETDYSNTVTMHWDMGTSGVQHSLFGFGAPPSDPNVQLVFASTE